MAGVLSVVLAAVVAIEPDLCESVGPVPVIDPYVVSFTNGVIVRDGQARFWAGNGCDLGSAQATPVGLWLAKVHGVTLTSHEPGTSFDLKEKGTNAEIRVNFKPGAQSWIREAIRLGMLTEMPNGGGQYFRSPLKKYSDAHPDFHEICYQAGHGVQFETLDPLGSRLLMHFRQPTLDYLKDEPHFIFELNREPAQYPANGLARAGFRSWARLKYADLAVANAVWGTSFASWEMVELPHMSTDPAQKKRWEVVRRNETKELMPNLYWDWLLYLQQYTEKTVKGELALLRSRYPKMPMTIDVRAHRNSTDGYCAYDPAAIDGLVDLFFIHYHFTACQYNDTPVDLKTLLSQTCFPLFCVNYLRTNTTHPLVDSEDIVGKVTLPFSNNDAMVRNDIGGLHRSPWKFRLEGPGDDGLAGRWFACDHDDARWGDVTVPGAWDVQPEYKGKGGIAWYRKRFTCKVNVMDYLDGSHRYYILGKGVAQSGMVWLNGEKVGDVKGWDSAYKFDVGHLLKFGGENEIVWRVDGSGRENGLRFYCHVLANDMINETVSFGERQFKSMFWTYLMGGVSGELVWHWMDDAVRPYYPRVLAPIEAAAPIVLPSVRNRRSKVAYLYAYAASMALPSVADGEYVPWLNWYCALEFSGVRPDVVGEEMFVRDVTPKSHPLLVVPHAKVVKDETYESFKRYVRAGGRVLLTTNSFSRTMSRYRLTDLAAFAAENPDRVTLVDPSLEMPAIQELLKPLLPEQDVKISGGDVRETPVIERALVGDGDRRVLYLHNWGGLAQPLVVKIPAEFSGWTATDLEGHFVRTGGAEFQVEVPSQVPVALALTRPGAMVPSVTPFAAQEAMLRELADLQKPISDAQRKALFPKRGNPYTVAGKVLFPNWLRELRCRGVSVEERPFSEWKLETLREYALVVIPEPNSAGFDKLSDPAVKSALRIYVEQGGSLVVLAWSAHTVNASGTSLKQVGGLFGVSSGWGTACDPAHSEYGDPFQILTDVIEPGPLAKGVSHVQLCAVDPLSLAKDSPLKAVVKIPATAKSGKDGVVVAAGDVGRGRVVFSAEIMAFQPYRIEAADNARLLSNIIDWLLQ